MLKLVNREKLPCVDFAFERLMEKAPHFKAHITVGIDDGLSLPPQGYEIKQEPERITVSAPDAAGLMYGVLDLARMIESSAVEPRRHEPYIKKRGIKFNLPLDARTPSYSDSSDSAQQNISNMWDMGFWRRFLDILAENKYNVLSLWSLHPFPSMVRVPEYPDVALDDIMATTTFINTNLRAHTMSNPDTLGELVTLKRMTIDEKTAFWRKVMDYAHERCIEIYIFTWNVFCFGTEHTDYGITADLDNQITIDYFRKSVKALIKTYPRLAGIGITAGENMSQTPRDEIWLRDSYGAGIKDALQFLPERQFTLIHRSHFTALDAIEQAFEGLPCAQSMSFKYSQAHMYSGIRPNFGDAFFDDLRGRKKTTWLTVRNDDFYMYRWADPAFAREYLTHMPHDILEGFYMGPDGYIWGREYISRDKNVFGGLVIEKMWMMLAIWGRLSYDINLSDGYFESLIKSRFPFADSKRLLAAWSAASRVIPLFQRTHWNNMDFQWYPEGCCFFRQTVEAPIFGSVNEFMQCPAMPGSGHLGVGEYCEAKHDGKTPSGITPLECAQEIYDNAAFAAKEAAELLSRENTGDPHLLATLNDILALSLLGRYYSLKLKAAVSLKDYMLQGGDECRRDAVKLLEDAHCVWSEYAQFSLRLYKPQMLNRFKHSIDLERFCHNTRLDVLIAKNTRTDALQHSCSSANDSIDSIR